MLSAFGRFNRGGGGGVLCSLSADLTFNEWGGGGGCCSLSADSTRVGGGGGCFPLSADSVSEVSALSADPVIQSVGGGC